MINNKDNISRKAHQIINVINSEEESINDKKCKLSDEYAKCYEHIEECFMKSNTSIKERGKCMDEALDMLIRAQDKKIPCKSVIGTVEKKFCQELINARGDNRFIIRLCIEIVKVPVTAFLAIFIYALMGVVDGDGLRGIYNDISIINAYVPAIVLVVAGNIIKYHSHSVSNVESEELVSRNRIINVLTVMLSVIAYIVMEDELSIPSYATTFERSGNLAVIAVISSVIAITIINLGGFEIIYRRKYGSDAKKRNYELMLYGFSSQYSTRNKHKEKKNERPITVKEYAAEIDGELKLTAKFLPIIIVILMVEIFLLAFLILGVGLKLSLIIGILLLTVAVSVCVALFITQNSRQGMVERILDGELQPQEFIDAVMKDE